MDAPFFDERTLAFGDQGVQQGGQPVGKQLGEQLCNAMDETNQPKVYYPHGVRFFGSKIIFAELRSSKP